MARGRPDRHLPLPPPGGEAPRVAATAGALAVQGPAPQVPPRSDRSAYPEARFVMTHRDPAKVVPSYASIVSAILPPAAGERDLHRLGREISEHLRDRDGERDRGTGPHRRGTVSRRAPTRARRSPDGYSPPGLRLAGPRAYAAVRESILDWQDANRSGAHRTHRYTAEQFGLVPSRSAPTTTSTSATSTWRWRAET